MAALAGGANLDEGTMRVVFFQSSLYVIIYGSRMDQITRKTTNPKCRLY
jgi:hypothetical protein